MSKPTPHGTANGYMNYDCRCPECRNAWRIYYRSKARGVCPRCGGSVSNRWNVKLCAACFREEVFVAEHGKEPTYRRGCRCEECRSEIARLRREHRATDRGRALQALSDWSK